MPDLIGETSVPLNQRGVSLAGSEATLAGKIQPTSPNWHRLDLSIQRQQQTEWCWAAVSVSIDDFYRRPTTWTQCRMVCGELGRNDCCANGGSAACNKPWYLEKALERAGIFAGLEPVPRPTFDLPPSAGSEIEAGRPVGLRVAWDGGGGHVLALEGIREDRAMVAVEDPWLGASELPPGLLIRYQGSGTLTHLFHTSS